MTADPHTTLMQDVNRTLAGMIDAGQTGMPQYGQLAQARSGLLSEPVGSPRYQSQEAVARAQMAQVEEANQQAFDQRVSSDPEFAAAACDCAPGEPCCLRAFEVEDASDGSRKVAWPIPQDGPGRLYVIAKDPVGGRPSAKAKVTLTDKETCKLNFARPSVNPRGHADGPQSIRDTDEITVTTPFQMPAFQSTMLPPELMTAIYLVGLFLQVKAYTEHDGATANPYQCMVPRATGLEVFPLPHCKLSAEASGSLAISIPIGRRPTCTIGVSCQVNGEVGNQTLQYSAGAQQISRPVVPQQQGPINHPLFDYLDSIQNAMTGLADEGNRQPVERRVPSPSAAFTLNLSIGCTVALPSLTLEAIPSSPNLQLAVDAFSISLNPAVSGTLDLLGILLTHIPNGNAIRDALAGRGNAMRVNAKLEITVGGSGTGSLALTNNLQVEVGDIDTLEADLSEASVTLTGSCQLTANVLALAEIDFDTWIIDAYASAGARADTGWQFGARVTNSEAGRKFERMHHFQGLILSGHAEAGLGGGTRDVVTSDPLAGLSTDDREVVNRTTDVFSARSSLARGTFRAVILEPSGGEDNWYEV
ncbi:hypothetical protein [Tateyamaria sp. SN6-1]|uniref:hypothetical protein n=1 Tax=Tateyamaria sp. SN6-1 TaxID=3092148 RepID=UPI0039F5CD77